MTKSLKSVAGVTGLEPAASGVTGQRSNQLSYTPIQARLEPLPDERTGVGQRATPVKLIQ